MFLLSEMWVCNQRQRKNLNLNPQNQGCGSAFIPSGSGSSILGWIPIRIRIQYGSKLLMTKYRKKLQLKKNSIFLEHKTTIYLYLGLDKERPSYRRSLQLSKVSTFEGHFCPLGSGSTDPIESWSNWDPDPQPPQNNGKTNNRNN